MRAVDYPAAALGGAMSAETGQWTRVATPCSAATRSKILDVADAGRVVTCDSTAHATNAIDVLSDIAAPRKNCL